MHLESHGIVADLPPGWEGAIEVERDRDAVSLAELGGVLRPVTHLGTFPLPRDRGDFGSGAVDMMGDEDAFVALVEYDPAEASSELFAARGLPRSLDPRAFSTQALQRQRGRQAGWQGFFNEGGRAFCLYVVLGDVDDVHLLARRVEQVLAGIRVEVER